MVSALLPGFRDFRVPFAVGCLWILVVESATQDQLRKTLEDPKSELLIAMSETLSMLPGAAVVSFAAFAAFILGSVVAATRPPRKIDALINDPEWTSFYEVASNETGAYEREGAHSRVSDDWSPLLQALFRRAAWRLSFRQRQAAGRLWTKLPRAARNRIGTWIEFVFQRAFDALENWWDRYVRWLDPPMRFESFGGRLSEMIHAHIERACAGGASISGIFETGVLSPSAHQQAGDFVGHAYALPAGDSDADQHEGAAREAISQAVITSIRRDLPSIATRLQAEKPEIHDDYGRKQAESELRIGIAVPLAVLGITATIGFEEPWALVLLPLAAALYMQGWRRYYEAESVLWTSIVYGIVELPDLLGLRTLDLDSERTPEVVWEEAMEDLRDRGLSFPIEESEGWQSS